MSIDISTELMESRVAKLSSLCKQYVSVLAKKKEELEGISTALINARNKSLNDAESREDEFNMAVSKLEAMQTGFSSLEPALRDLIRTASQAVEHSTKDDVDGLELRVVLAELEANLQQARMLMYHGLLPLTSR